MAIGFIFKIALATSLDSDKRVNIQIALDTSLNSDKRVNFIDIEGTSLNGKQWQQNQNQKSSGHCSIFLNQHEVFKYSTSYILQKLLTQIKEFQFGKKQLN